MSKEKIIIILVAFLDVLGISIVIPTLPDLAVHYWVSNHMISYWVTWYAFASFLASPILGQLSDVYGRKKILTLCVIGTFLSCLIIIFSQSSFIYFLIWRLLHWFVWWNMSILQAVINDISKNKTERMTNMWILWTLFWTAFIIWPIFWAFLLHFDVMTPYIFMAILGLIEIFVLIFFLNETNKNMWYKPIKYNPLWLIKKYIKKENIRYYLISLFFILFWISIYQSIISLYLNKQFGMTWSQTWYLFASIWLLLVINQAFFLRKFWLKRFDPKTLIYIANFWIFTIYLLLSLYTNIYYFILIYLCLVPFQSLVNPVYQIEIMDLVAENKKWEISWVTASIHSISMFLWPLLWGFLIDKDYNIFIISAVVIFFSILVVFKINNEKYP